jgi:hypothetical protein
MIEVVKIKPHRHKNNPNKLIKPSFSNSPKPTTKMPMAGRVFVPGMGMGIL